MYAVVITAHGGSEVLEWTEVDDPVPGPGEVLVDIAASAVNRADLLQRQGVYPVPKGAPPYPGLECSGTTPDGTAVCALLSGGGYAQRVCAPAEHLLPVPAGVSLVDAAALPEVACTVWSNLIGVARLRPGETLLVHGGASGIGTFAIQFATALGVEVHATARATKHDAVRALGATPIDYETTDFAEAVKADVILDIMGAAYLERNLKALRTGGRLVIIGLQGGRRTEIDLSALTTKRALVAGTTLRSRPADEKAAIVRGVRDDVWPLVEAGRIRPVIDRRIPMRDAAEAHRVVENSAHIGKVLLVNG